MTVPLSKIKPVVTLLLLCMLGIVAAVAMAEVYLRWRADRIQKSNQLEPGMVRYDPLLGWKLNPGWKGSHRHHDFQVSYSINPYGFRGDFRKYQSGCRNLNAFVGDSFTFGIGVEDGQTFVDLLNENSGTACYLNFSVPGYSTDQEFMLIKDTVVSYAPRVVYLVVYLGNDLFDNPRSYPLQGQNAKPYFRPGTDALILHNSPVPILSKTAEQARADLAFLAFDQVARRTQLEDWMFRHSLLIRSMGTAWMKTAPVDVESAVSSLLEKELDLFRAIVNQVESVSHRRNFKLVLILLPGRSYLERQGSISHRVQSYLKEEIKSFSKLRAIPAIDLADGMQRLNSRGSGDLYFKHEGHLTPEGHRVVAGLIKRWQSGR